MSSSCFEADSNSDLHSVAFGEGDGRAEQLRQSFAKVITNYYNESGDSVGDEGKPDIKDTGQLSESETADETYDMKAADKKQKEVAYLAQFMHKDLGYTLKDIEYIQKQCDKKAIGVSKEIKKQTDHMDQKVDSMMSKIINLIDFSKFAPPLEQVNEEEEPQAD